MDRGDLHRYVIHTHKKNKKTDESEKQSIEFKDVND